MYDDRTINVKIKIFFNFNSVLKKIKRILYNELDVIKVLTFFVLILLLRKIDLITKSKITV